MVTSRHYTKGTPKKKKRKPKDSEVNSKLINAVNLHVSFKKLKKEKQRVF